MNITFGYLHFTSISEVCQLGYLSITQLQNKAKPFVFCGQNSKFTLYPPFGLFQIGVGYHFHIFFKIHFFYVIIDNSIFSSIRLKYISVPNPVRIVSRTLIRKKTTLLSLVISVIKINYIELKMHQQCFTKYFVFDGPGFSSQILKMQNNHFKT